MHYIYACGDVATLNKLHSYNCIWCIYIAISQGRLGAKPIMLKIILSQNLSNYKPSQVTYNYTGEQGVTANFSSQFSLLPSCKLEPNMLKNLPIVLSRTSQNFYPLFLFYSHSTTYYSFLFYCVNNNITMQEWLYIICIVTDCFNEIFDCSIRVSRSFCKQGGKAQQAFGRVWACQACLWLHHYLKLICITCFSYFSIQLFLFYACAWPIILELFLSKLWPIILKIMPAY